MYYNVQKYQCLTLYSLHIYYHICTNKRNENYLIFEIPVEKNTLLHSIYAYLIK